jgi:hypothetical protein
LKNIAVIAATFAPVGTAYGMDLAVQPPNDVAPSTWTGVYIGGKVGWRHGNYGSCTDAGINNCGKVNNDVVSQSDCVVIGGAQFGARYQCGDFVSGIKGLYEALDAPARPSFAIAGTSSRHPDKAIEPCLDLRPTIVGHDSDGKLPRTLRISPDPDEGSH